MENEDFNTKVGDTDMNNFQEEIVSDRRANQNMYEPNIKKLRILNSETVSQTFNNDINGVIGEYRNNRNGL